MASLRDSAACIGIAGDFSVVGDYYGYLAPPRDLSVLTQIMLLQGRHVHANLIRVGIESFDAADEADIDSAVQFTRNTFAQVSLGVGRVQRFFITTAEADGRDNIGSNGEAEDLTNEWTVPNHALDIFFVLSYAGDTAGLSREDGPCDKDAKGMDGSVVAMDTISGIVLAHEVGHYLGLGHSGNDDNLMFESAPNGGLLTSGQGSVMRDHCFANGGC